MSRYLALAILLAGWGVSNASNALAQIPEILNPNPKKHIPATKPKNIPDALNPDPKKHIPATTPIRPMETYCITYTDMKGPKDAEGRARIRYKTRHLRAGIDAAKVYADGIYGSKNVRSVDRGGCTGVYARKAAEEAARKAR